MSIHSVKTHRDNSINKTSVPAGYNWVPAATTNTYATLKVEKRKSTFGHHPKVATLLKTGNRVTHTVRTPDFDLLVSTDPVKVKDDSSEEGKTIELGLRTLTTAGFALYGAYDAPKKSKAMWRDFIRKHSYVIQDSGGFQLATGVVEFLDPLDVAKAHTLYADAGVSLDIPAHGSKDVELLMATARVLSANNEVLRDATAKQVRLLNVSQGSTLGIRKAFLKIALQGEKLDGISIGGLRQNAVQVTAGAITPLAFTKHVLLVILSTEKLYSHYHVLGVASDWQMAILSAIARMHKLSITSDSASHHLSGLAGHLLDYGDASRPGVKIGVGKDWGFARCCCLVCGTVRYERVLRQQASLATLHNSLVLTRRARLMWRISALQRRVAPDKFAEILYENTTSLGAGAQAKRSFYEAIHLISSATKVDDLRQTDGGGSDLRKGVLFGSSDAPKESRVLQLVKKFEEYHGKKFRT